MVNQPESSGSIWLHILVGCGSRRFSCWVNYCRLSHRFTTAYRQDRRSLFGDRVSNRGRFSLGA